MTNKNLRALTSMDGIKCYNLKMLLENSCQGCSLCCVLFKVLYSEREYGEHEEHSRLFANCKGSRFRIEPDGRSLDIAILEMQSLLATLGWGGHYFDVFAQRQRLRRVL
jgi:hypothetical protein